jgi:hypothetical protein
MASIKLFDDDLDLNGVPAAVPQDTPAATGVAAVPADILVVASQQAAQDGSYQALVTELSGKGKVEMQMVDRVVEGGESLRPSLEEGRGREDRHTPAIAGLRRSSAFSSASHGRPDFPQAPERSLTCLLRRVDSISNLTPDLAVQTDRRPVAGDDGVGLPARSP